MWFGGLHGFVAVTTESEGGTKGTRPYSGDGVKKEWVGPGPCCGGDGPAGGTNKVSVY